MTALAAPRADPALRRVLDRCLGGIASLLATARPLPEQLASSGLAMESAAILRLARRLEARLRRRDPLAERVVPSRVAFVGNAAIGALGVLARRALRSGRRMQTARQG